MKLKLNRKRIQQIGAISFTDVVFLLLIFFLLSSSFVIQTGLKVDLPKVKKQDMHTQQETTVTLTRDGRVFINEEVVDRKHFPLKLFQIVKTRPDKTVIFKADAHQSIENLVELIDMARGVGVEKFLIGTKPKEE